MSKDNSRNWGGKRSGAGRPYRQRLFLDEETARTLRILLLHKRDLLSKPGLTEEQVVQELVDQAWHELDELFLEKSEDRE
jgi:hypothetical protein